MDKSSLLYDKSDVQINNDDLREINEWAYAHAKTCQMMDSTIKGHSKITYTIEYCKDTDKLSCGCQCQCGTNMNLSDFNMS